MSEDERCRRILAAVQARGTVSMREVAQLAGTSEVRARRDLRVAYRSEPGGRQLEDVIGALNLFLRGWVNYFRTGNASDKVVEFDRHVAWRLKRLLLEQRGRNLRAGQPGKWTPAWFHDQGLNQLMGTIRYPKTA